MILDPVEKCVLKPAELRSSERVRSLVPCFVGLERDLALGSYLSDSRACALCDGLETKCSMKTFHGILTRIILRKQVPNPLPFYVPSSQITQLQITSMMGTLYDYAFPTSCLSALQFYRKVIH